MGKRDDFLRLVQVSSLHYETSAALHRMKIAMRMPEEAFPDDVIAAFDAWRDWQVFKDGNPNDAPAWVAEYEQNLASKRAASETWVLQEGPEWISTEQETWRELLKRDVLFKSSEGFTFVFWTTTVAGQAPNFSIQMTKSDLDLFLAAMRKTDGWLEEFVEYHPLKKAP